MSEGGDGGEGQPSEQVRALGVTMSHPFRAKLLFAVAERSDQGVSIRQLSQRLREPPRKIRYHLDALAELGLVAVASRRSRRNAVERFYRAEQTPLLTTEQLDEYDERQARQMSLQVLRTILSDASLAVEGKVFGLRSGHILIRVPGEVDEQGWREIGEVQEQALSEVQGVMARSRGRLEVSDQIPVSALVAFLLFEVPPWPSP